jgi:hypothetical protein
MISCRLPVADGQAQGKSWNRIRHSNEAEALLDSEILIRFRLAD